MQLSACMHAMDYISQNLLGSVVLHMAICCWQTSQHAKSSWQTHNLQVFKVMPLTLHRRYKTWLRCTPGFGGSSCTAAALAEGRL